MDRQVELWKKHPEIDSIEVSTFGRIRSVKGHYYKSNRINSGYLQVYFRMNGKQINKLVHRLVAETFIPNPDNLLEVNHKDCDKTNNDVSNLEWVTHEENIAYRGKCGHTARNNAPKSPVYVINLSNLEVSHFQSQSEASRVLGFSVSSINAVIKGRLKQAHGFWFVKDDGHAVDVVKIKLHGIGGTGLKIETPECFIVQEDHYGMYIGAVGLLIADKCHAKVYNSRDEANEVAADMHLNAWEVIPYGD